MSKRIHLEFMLINQLAFSRGWVSRPSQLIHYILFALIFGCFLAIPAVSQTLFLDFNTVGQYSANFNPWNDSGGLNAGNYAFAESTTAGVNGSGGVSVFQSTDTSATYNGGSWNFSTNGPAKVVSAMAKADGQSHA